MAKSFLIALTGLLLLIGCQQEEELVLAPTPAYQAPAVKQETPAPPVAQKPTKAGPEKSPAVRKVASPKQPGVPEEWVPNAPANNWQYIVIHHSATPTGSAAVFDREHRHKGWDELGYHFVIGNGSNSGNGQVEVGSRWPKQKWGAHAKTPDQRYNNYGIGICLVGNFDIDRPSAAQVRSVARLTAYLMKTYHIPASRVLGHGDTKPTDCPGRNFSVAEIRKQAIAMIAEGEVPAEFAPIPVAGTELLRDVASNTVR